MGVYGSFPARLRVCQVEVEVAHVVLIAEVVVHLRVVVDELRVGLDDPDDGDVFEEVGFTVRGRGDQSQRV
jgi:hypothetical protein